MRTKFSADGTDYTPPPELQTEENHVTLLQQDLLRTEAENQAIRVTLEQYRQALQDALANLNESIDNGKRFKLNDIEKIFGFNDAACANICRVSEVTFQQWKYGQMSFPAWAAAKLGRELNFDVARVDWPRKRSANAGGQS